MKIPGLVRLVFLLLACANSWATERGAVRTRLVEGNNEFALDLYRRLAFGRKGNIFCSPYSVSSALGMAYAGAAGETALEMARALRFREQGDRLHGAFAELGKALEAAGQGRSKLIVANALWGQKGLGFKDDFLALTRRDYGAGLQELDFQADAEGARRRINAWTEEKTQGTIRDLVQKGLLDERTWLVLTNAIYFKGSWESPFDKGRTKESVFHRAGSKDDLVHLMYERAKFGYVEIPGLQGLELPYAGDRLSMVILLPRQIGGLGALERQLSEKRLMGWLAGLERTQVDAYVPRFKMTAQFELGAVLRSLGMEAAFTPEGDFSAMGGRRGLFLSSVIHKAFVEVGEEGTEAAAATAVINAVPATARPREKPRPVFRADHPFLFIIRDRGSGSILFIGRMNDPQG